MTDRRAAAFASSATSGLGELPERWGRDFGPVSTRNTSKGALIGEAQAVFKALAGGATVAEVRVACLEGQLLRQPAFITRSRIWDALHWRYFSWQPPPWVLTDIAEAARQDSADPAFKGLLFLHYARRDRLTFDFVTQKIWSYWKSGQNLVTRQDVLDFLDDLKPSTPQIGRWREASRNKLAGNLLSALRDFGLLAGAQKKTLRRPVVAPQVVLHLVRLLDGEGLRGRAVLEALDWRLLLWDVHGVAGALGSLSQGGKLRFERVGNTVMLDLVDQQLGGP